MKNQQFFEKIFTLNFKIRDCQFVDDVK